MEVYQLACVVICVVFNVEAQKCPTTASLQGRAINNNGETYIIPAGAAFSSEDDDHCYIALIDKKRTWTESKDICHFMANSLDIIAEQQGQMATIKNENEQTVIAKMLDKAFTDQLLLSNDNLWTGAQLVSDVQEVLNSGFGKNTDYNVLRVTSRGPSASEWIDRTTKPGFNLDPLLLAEQGCYWSTSSTQTVSVPYDTLPANKVTPETCMKICNIYTYWAVRVESTGPRCLCLFSGYAEDPDGPVDTYEAYTAELPGRQSYFCNQPCNDTTRICGGRQVTDINAGAVYLRYPQLVGVVNGVNSTLRYGTQQPNNAEGNEYYFVVDVTSWRVHDVKIYNNQYSRYPVICEIACTQGSLQLGNTGKCVYISPTFFSNTYLTYFEAKKTCREQGGDIIYFQKESEWNALKELYRQMGQQNRAAETTDLGYPVRFIIGQTGRDLMWVDCNKDKKNCEYDNEYANFDQREPRKGEHCINLVVNPTAEVDVRYKWRTAQCDSTLNTLCEIALREDNIDQCDSNPCVNNGLCEDGYLRYICKCQSGWTGTNCEINVDNCSPVNPCQNGGQCVDQVGFYTCDCAQGWGGQDCTQDLDSCAVENPCRNGGQCVDQPQGFTCNCAAGFEGPDCRTNIDDCALLPLCLNGAICEDGVQSRFCRCAAGFAGARCENNINECSLQPCLNGGTCFDDTNRRVCQCAQGYTGESCEMNIDDCNLQPCLNGGVCFDGINSRTCQCARGFSGISCEINTDDCNLQPCLNGGVCLDGINSRTCQCTLGFTGVSCETNIDDCSLRPCLNGGNCFDGVNSRTCQCSSGFTGVSCEINIQECESRTCQNGGTCVDGIGTSTCQCALGWTGVDCEIDIPECASRTCLNGATCVDGVGTSTCQCVPGWTGINCESDVNDCAENPCLNGGTCEDSFNSVTCKCLPGWFGNRCATRLSDCSVITCENGGTCTNTGNTGSCTCAPGWSGDRCESDLNECDSDPCKNGGTCANGVAQFTCACAQGWTGADCGQDIDECASNPCLNGASCTNGLNVFTCQCAAGFEGSNCGTQIAVTCTPNPCQNSGTCSLVNGQVRCACTSSWAGQFCEVEAGQSIVEDGLSDFEIALIIILVILFIVIIIAIILFCCYKKKDKKRRKQISAYDARPVAPVPSSGPLGEEIYMAESDKAGLFADPSVFRTSGEVQYSARSPRYNIDNHDDYDINRS